MGGFDLKVVSLKDKQRISFEILCYIKKTCEQNNITYFISYGTLLGAVRHKGFIPWDDDIDISVPREDYDRLVFLLEKNQTKYKIFTMDNSSDYYFVTAQVVDLRTIQIGHNRTNIKDYGVFVDIFPLDGVPHNIILKYIHSIYILVLGSCLSASSQIKFVKTKNPIKTIIKGVLFKFVKWIGNDRWQRLFNEAVRKYPFFISDEFCNYSSSYGFKRECFSKIYIESFVDIEFCEEKFKAPAMFDAFLHQIYGEYMQLPPVDKRHTSHGDAWWKE